MKISTRGRYGTRVMIELALHHGGGPVKVKDLAVRQELSAKYVEQIVARLKAAGLVTATHGAHGGYTLSRPPADIRLREVFETLEGPLSLVHCTADPARCSRSRVCVTQDIWGDIPDQIRRILESTTLHDMADRYRGKQQAVGPVYTI